MVEIMFSMIQENRFETVLKKSRHECSPENFVKFSEYLYSGALAHK